MPRKEWDFDDAHSRVIVLDDENGEKYRARYVIRSLEESLAMYSAIVGRKLAVYHLAKRTNACERR